jgi:hypothetical protein
MTVEQVLKAMKKCGIYDIMLGRTVQLDENQPLSLQKNEKNHLIFSCTENSVLREKNKDDELEEERELKVDQVLFQKLEEFRETIYEGRKKRQKKLHITLFTKVLKKVSLKKLLKIFILRTLKSLIHLLLRV